MKRNDVFPPLKSQEELDKKPIQWDIVAAWVIPIILITIGWYYLIAWLAS